VTKHSLIQ